MRNQNKIDVSFTQPLQETHSLVHKKIEQENRPHLYTLKTIQEIVQKIGLADILSSSLNSRRSESSSIDRNVSKLKSKNDDHEDPDECAIDGKPFFIDKKEIRNKIQKMFDQPENKSVKIDDIVDGERTFKQWAKTSRNEFKNPRQAMQSNDEQLSDVSSIKSSITVTKTKRGRRQRKIKSRGKYSIKKVAGHMFGPFTETPTPDKLTVKSDKFGVPLSMMQRAEKDRKKRKIQEDVLRRVRLSHMGYTQPPDKDESSENESVQNVKRLALIRTPYFMMPTIKISQVKKKDRFRNKYLKKDSLKRINILLLDRENQTVDLDSKSGEDSVENVLNDSEPGDSSFKSTSPATKKHQYFAKFFQLSNQKKSILKRIPTKEKYYKIILDKFEEQKKQCEPDDEVS